MSDTMDRINISVPRWLRGKMKAYRESHRVNWSQVCVHAILDVIEGRSQVEDSWVSNNIRKKVRR
jgi:hypothetical protein